MITKPKNQNISSNNLYGGNYKPIEKLISQYNKQSLKLNFEEMNEDMSKFFKISGKKIFQPNYANGKRRIKKKEDN